MKGNKRISNKLYYKALLRCNQILGEYLSRSKKSNLIDDILEVNQNKNEINKTNYNNNFNVNNYNTNNNKDDNDDCRRKTISFF